MIVDAVQPKWLQWWPGRRIIRDMQNMHGRVSPQEYTQMKPCFTCLLAFKPSILHAVIGQLSLARPGQSPVTSASSDSSDSLPKAEDISGSGEGTGSKLLQSTKIWWNVVSNQFRGWNLVSVCIHSIHKSLGESLNNYVDILLIKLLQSTLLKIWLVRLWVYFWLFWI